MHSILFFPLVSQFYLSFGRLTCISCGKGSSGTSWAQEIHNFISVCVFAFELTISSIVKVFFAARILAEKLKEGCDAAEALKDPGLWKACWRG